MGLKGALLLLLKIAPLAIFLRSAACKFELPVGGCETPLCPVAIGKPGDCSPTANTAESKAWCEHGWVPWANGLIKQGTAELKKLGVDAPMLDNLSVECQAPDYKLMKAIGAIEVVGWLLLWISPKLGGFILAATMAGAIHFHMTAMGDKPEALGLQFSLLVASLFVFLFDSPSSSADDKKKTA